MELHESAPTMNQRIFDLGLPTETVSLYLLLCGLTDAGISLTKENIRERWNDSDEALEKSARELERKNIITRLESEGEDNAAFKLTDVHGWR